MFIGWGILSSSDVNAGGGKVGIYNLFGIRGNEVRASMKDGDFNKLVDGNSFEKGT